LPKRGEDPTLRQQGEGLHFIGRRQVAEIRDDSGPDGPKFGETARGEVCYEQGAVLTQPEPKDEAVLPRTVAFSPDGVEQAAVKPEDQKLGFAMRDEGGVLAKPGIDEPPERHGIMWEGGEEDFGVPRRCLELAKVTEVAVDDGAGCLWALRGRAAAGAQEDEEAEPSAARS
jgi:hypothetical protein